MEKATKKTTKGLGELNVEEATKDEMGKFLGGGTEKTKQGKKKKSWLGGMFSPEPPCEGDTPQ